MGQIIYNITAGVPDFLVSLSPLVVPSQTQTALGVYSFDSVPDGWYWLTVVDGQRCRVRIHVGVNIDPCRLAGTIDCNVDCTLVGIIDCDFTTTTTTTILCDDCYGLLYNWFAVDDARNIAAVDWKVPSDAEWTILTDYLIANGYGYGGSGVDIGKSIAYPTCWELDPTPGHVGNDQITNNASGFSGKPGGHRTEFAAFYDITYFALFWTSTEYSVLNAYNTGTSRVRNDVFRVNNHKNGAYSIRLLKETTEKTHGQTGTYIGNDGTVYNTICIGTQEWMSENLEETQYRNSDPIIEVTGAGAWAVLVTGAMCAYDNSWTYACKAIPPTTTTTTTIP